MTGASLDLDIRMPLAGFALQVHEAVPLRGITAILGPSGSGKSTLLRIIAGLEPGATGRVAAFGETWQDVAPEGMRFVPPHRRGVGMVFQDTRLFPHLTVAGNLRYAATRARGLGGPEETDIVARFDLGPLLDRRPARLSGGERSRVAIARALLAAPRLLLMDEPLASLDEARKGEILPYLERLRDNARVPVIYVSHAMAEVARLADHIVVLQDGAVRASRPAAELLADPAAVPIIGPREAGAILSARVVAQDDDGLTRLAVSGGELFLPHIAAPVGAHLRVRIPAQDVLIALDRPQGISALNILPGTIVAVKDGAGPGAVVQIRCGEELILARLTRRSSAALALAPGMACYAIVKSVAVAQGDVGAGH